MEFRNGYYSDIDLSEIFLKTMVAAIICGIIFGVGVLAAWENISDDIESATKYNDWAERFNALSEPDRITAAPFALYEIPKGQTTLEMMEVPERFGKQIGGKMPPVVTLIALVLSETTFLSYCKEKHYTYYLADLPLRRPCGWVILLSCFAGWPIMAISAVRIIIFKYMGARGERKTIEKQLIDEEVTYEDPASPIVLRRTVKARAQYVKRRVGGAQRAFEHRRAELVELEEKQRDELRRLGSQVKAQQERIGKTLAEKQRLKNATVTDVGTREQAMQEWETISKMRGVSAMSTRWQYRGEKNPPLVICVKVRVPYKRALYDFGDYQVVIDDDDFTCRRTRSGVKINQTSTAPDYNEKDGFCFGSRSSTIRDYIRNGRLLEAITLIVDSLHAVNGNSDGKMIPYCFRKVSTVKRVERWLKIKRKLGVM